LNSLRSKAEDSFHLVLTVKPPLIRKFSVILQKGFTFKTRVGISIESFLCDDLALNPQFVQEEISTIFLDGKAVDSIESALLREGVTLALSSAMPGLAGASLRRDGMYAALRSPITYKEKPGNAPIREGRIIIKLFNLLIEELGPLFLKKGILVKASEAREFFMKQGADLRQGCGPILLDEKAVDCETLLSGNWLTGHGDLELTVVTL